MKSWKNRNRRSKKHKQRGGVKNTPETASAPVLPPPVAAQPAGQAVYALNAPAAADGQPRTIADCNRMLDAAKARIAELEGNLAVEAGRLAGVTKEREAEMARLGRDIAASQAEVEAATQAMAALRGEKGAIQAELERIQTELRDKLGELADASLLNKSLRTAKDSLEGTLRNKDQLISILQPLRGQLDTLKASSQAEITQKNTQIQQIREQHRAELADTNGRYQADLEKLRADMRKLEGSNAGTAAEKRRIEEQKAELEGQIAAFEARIRDLTKGLEESQAATVREAQEKAAAAAASREAATAEAEKLDTATREGQELQTRLRAAQGAKEAADRAAAEAAAARETAEAAARAAAERVTAAEREAAAERAAAEAAVASKAASEAERNRAQEVAQAAEAEKAAAVRDAAARAEEVARAQQAAEAAVAQRDVMQARLDALEESVPKIISIKAADGTLVGGEGGRSAVYGEPLTVTWNLGAVDRDTWVFVMFATVEGNTVPVYSQLVLNDQSFTFTSTVDGDVQAVVYDVVSHSRGAIGF